ncbi:hypothetical protein G7046_g4988 [Stylonectria norvegica]|nr:hypothetical protein G7046_g4988 [Stylonectria norvegica]
MAPHDGLVHLKEYDIKDSNVELIGSDIDHKVKFNSAATEPAWNDGNVGVKPGLLIWRIEQFEVIAWPKEKHSLFYDGDSFIVLQSRKVGDKNGTERLAHDVFFWLGSHTSQDEAATAAYKAVELDEFLKGSATQHREIQEAPSEDLLALFPHISIRAGGVRTGFRHVGEEAKEEIITLLRVFKNPVAGANGLIVCEVEPTWRSLDDGDVFVLDTGNKIWVWQGQNCSPMEKAKAAQVVHDLNMAKHSQVEVLSQAESRSKRVVDLLARDEDTPRDGFQCKRPVASGNHLRATQGPTKLFRLSDASGELDFELVKEGQRIARDDLDGNDVFLLDHGGQAVWVWEGLRASVAERKAWLRVAQSYVRRLRGGDGDEYAYLTPLGKVVEGNESSAFLRIMKS